MITIKDSNLLTNLHKYKFLDTLTVNELLYNSLSELELMFNEYLLDTIYETDNNYLA